MEPLKRKILFDKKSQPLQEGRMKGNTKKATGPLRAAPPPPGLPTKSMADKSDNIIQWLVLHPLFKTAGMCRQIGYDPANFQKLKRLPDDLIEKIEPILRQYGFTQ